MRYREIVKVHMTNTTNSVALSFVSVYIPAYLLTIGYSLQVVIFYFAISHVVGLLAGLFVFTPIISKVGVMHVYKLYVPFQFLYLLLLLILETNPDFILLCVIAMLGGLANFAYYLPMNLLFFNNSDVKKMGSDISWTFTLPKIFGIIGPLSAAILVPLFGFWLVFVIAIVGILLSYYPISKIKSKDIKIDLNLKKSIKKFKKHKGLFVLECFDNIVEESEWFWGIYVFILIGSLSVPGYIGALGAIGGGLFALVVGKFSNRNNKKLLFVGIIGVILTSVAKAYVTETLAAYILTVVSSFILSLFLITYFSTIYKTVKHSDDENQEEFLILREIPTVLGRLIVFAGILIFINNLNYFFYVPIFFMLLLLVVYIKNYKTLK